MNKRDILSKDELHALQAASTHNNASSDFSLYDFHQPIHILKTRLPAIEIINDRFSKLLEKLIQSFVNKHVNILSDNIEMLKYEDYIATLPPITNSTKYKISPLNGNILCINTTELVYALVEYYFGAIGDIRTVDQRDFTATEIGVIEKFNEELIAIYAQSWDSIHSLHFDKKISENRTQAISFVDGSDVIIISKFIAEIENTKGEVHIILPYAAFEPIKNILVSGIARENINTDDFWYKQLQEKIYEASIELRAELSQIDITLADLMTLKDGDFIPLRKHEKCTIYAENYPVFEGKIGVSNQTSAVKLLGWHRH